MTANSSDRLVKEMMICIRFIHLNDKVRKVLHENQISKDKKIWIVVFYYCSRLYIFYQPKVQKDLSIPSGTHDKFLSEITKILLNWVDDAC